MKHTRFKTLKTAMLLATALTSGLTLRAQKLKPVPQKDATKLKALVSEELPAQAKAHKILVFWRCEGYVHSKSIEYGIEAFKRLAAQHPAYQIDFSREYARLAPANLKTYKTLVLMNTTRLNTKDQANRNLEYDLINFVKSGGGLTVIHAGSDNFYAAEAAAEMIGGRFWGHPWGAGGTWAFKVEEPGHPINKAFPKANFKWSDEIYQQQSPFYNRAKLRVLISLDMNDKATNNAKGQRRPDKDNPVSWIRPYGKGRVFYTSFAHDQRAWLDKAVFTHIIAGMQYTLGDLKADDTPAGLTVADIKMIRDADEIELHQAFALLQDILRNTHNEKVHQSNLSKIIPILSDKSASPHGKQAVLRALISSGVQPAANAVAPALRARETRDWAITLLAGIDSPAAKKILESELKTSKGADQITLINALAMRKESQAIIPLMKSDDAIVAAAAVSGVGRIADNAALAALMQLKTDKLKATRDTALAACVGTMAAHGNLKRAAEASRILLCQNDASEALMAACAKAILLSDPDFFAEGFKMKSAKARETLVRHADSVDNTMLVTAMPPARPSDQVAIITKLASKNAGECASAIAKMLDSDNSQVVAAALKALSRLGSEEHVPAMFAKLRSEDRAVKEAAKAALEDMLCAKTSAALIKAAVSDTEKQKSVLQLLAARRKTDDLPAFADFLKSSDAGVRGEAWKALADICDNKSYPQLMALLPLIQESEASKAASALKSALGDVDAQTRVKSITSAWNNAASGAKMALIDVMLRYSDNRYVPLISKAINSSNKAVAEAAIRALGSWPTLKPYDELVSALETQSDTNLKKSVYRAALKLAMAKGSKKTDSMCVVLFKKAPTNDDRATLAKLYYKKKTTDLFPLLKSCFNDPETEAVAKRLYARYYNEKIKSAENIIGGKELDPKKWQVKASHRGSDAKKAIDRNDESRWTSGTFSQAGMWFAIDLGEKSFISEILLDTTRSANDTPNGCEIFISDDGKNWGNPVASADGGSVKKTLIKLAVSGRHIKIVTTGERNNLYWSIHEVYVKSGMDKKLMEEIQKTAESL